MSFFENFFNQNNTVALDFDPELIMLNLDSGLSTSIRVASGDAANINKNLKVDLQDVTELTISFDGFEKYEDNSLPKTNDSPNTTIGSVSLKIIKNSEEKFIKLTDHKIKVYPNKIKSKCYEYPDISEVKEAIQEIWGEVFSDALADFMLAKTEEPTSTRSKTHGNKSKFNIAIKILSGFLAISLISILATVGFKKFAAAKPSNQQTILNEINSMPDTPANTQSTDSQQPQLDSAKQADKEAMQEFGLDDGVKLE